MRFVNPRPYIMTDRTASTARLRSFNRESFLADRPITDTKEKSFFVRIVLHRGGFRCSSQLFRPDSFSSSSLLCAPRGSEIGASRCMMYARRTRNQRRPSSPDFYIDRETRSGWAEQQCCAYIIQNGSRRNEKFRPKKGFERCKRSFDLSR